MYLKQLDIIQYKNISLASVALGPKLNCFTGNNGEGKTNLLDAVFYLSLCKSALGVTDGQCVRNDDDFFVLEGQYDFLEKSSDTVSCSYKRGAGKTIRRNDKEYSKIIDHIGLFPVVLVAPGDASLVFNSEDRRRYINALLSQLDKEYLVALIKYNNVVVQRNKLLKEIYKNGGFEILDILDAQLCHYGDTIHHKRAKLIHTIAPIAEQYYNTLSNGKETITLQYDSDLNDTPLSDLLKSTREKDILLKHTSMGVHRDDITLSISGLPIRRFGSQGQQKSLLIAIKLAQFDIITQHKGFKPILLLDDIFDKLDMGRVENLMQIVSQKKFGQIFITDSNKIRMETILTTLQGDNRIFNVQNGAIQQSL